jgi:anti-sigma-K factor RskA
LEELAAVFAVAAMTVEERDQYIEHLGICPVCEELAGQFRGVVELLPDALAVEPASPDLKSRVLAQAAAESGRGTARVPQRPASPRQRRFGWLWPAGGSPLPAAAMAVLVMAVLGLTAWNMALRQNVQERDQVLLQHQAVIRSLVAGGQVHQVKGTEAAPEAAAVLIQNSGREDSVLIITGLASLPAGMEYQVWHIIGQDVAPIGAGTFSIPDSNALLVTIPINFSPTESIGVSVEPAGGSPAPTGDIVLLGTL